MNRELAHHRPRRACDHRTAPPTRPPRIERGRFPAETHCLTSLRHLPCYAPRSANRQQPDTRSIGPPRPPRDAAHTCSARETCTNPARISGDLSRRSQAPWRRHSRTATQTSFVVASQLVTGSSPAHICAALLLPNPERPKQSAMSGVITGVVSAPRCKRSRVDHRRRRREARNHRNRDRFDRAQRLARNRPGQQAPDGPTDRNPRVAASTQAQTPHA